MPDPVRYGDEATISDGVASLNRFPGCMLELPVFSLFPGMPTDGGGIKQNLGALHRGQASRFRIPLIPADEHADFCIARLPRAKTEVPGSEIKLFIIEWIIGNV